MRIGILANVGYHFDAFWVEIVSYLQQAGHEIYLGAGTSSENISVDLVRGITRRPSVSNIQARKGLNNWVNRRNLDVILTNTATPSALARIFQPGVPVVYFAHGLHWRIPANVGDRFWQFFESSLMTRTAGIIVINDEDESWARKQSGDIPILRLPYGVGLNTAKFVRKPLPAGKNVVWIGEFIERKRPLDAVEAFRILARSGAGYRLFMLGDGPMKSKVESAIMKYNLQTKVELPGRVPPQDFLTGSTALLHTASWEGLPRVALEALATGRPIVGYGIKGLNGLPGTVLVKDGSTEELAQTLRLVMQEPEKHVADVSPSDLSWLNSATLLAGFLEAVVYN